MNKVTTENVRELPRRYMEGESTQAEQKMLREYFDGGQDLPDDLAPFAQMFAIIDEATPTPSVEALDRFASQTEGKRKRFLIWPFIAAACIAAFAFVLLAPPQQKEESMAIAYVDGKMLNNEVQAMQMGQEALQEIFSNGNHEQQLSELFNEP